MGELIRLSDVRYPWKELATIDGPNSTLYVYSNTQTGEAEIVQMNDDGESIRTVLAPEDVAVLQAALALKSKRAQ